MKNKLLLFLMLVVSVTWVQAQNTTESVYVEKAGTLQELVSKLESLRINTLKVTGEINGADLAYITKMTGKLIDLQSLDISDVKLIPGDEPYRTISWQGSDLQTYTSAYCISETNWDGEMDFFSKTTNYYRNNLAGAFCEMTTLQEVKLPKTLDAIGEEMFLRCEALTSVEFPENLKEIGSSAFYQCSKLSVNLPVGLEKIGAAAFKICTALKGDLDLSKIKSLGEDAFRDCSSLTSLILSADLEKIEESVFSGCQGLTTVAFTVSTGKLKEIGEYAFYACKGLTSIEIPDGVESIGTRAFIGAALTSVVIPNSVYKIGESAFGGTPWWEEQRKATKEGLLYIGNVACEWMGKMPDKTSVILKDGTTGVSDKLFYRQNGLVSVSFPNTVKSIGNESFNECKNLQTAELNEGLTSIGERAFYACSGLASITVPSTVTYFGYNSFGGCLGLVKVNFNAKSGSAFGDDWGHSGSIFGGCTGLESVVVGENVEVIPEGAFCECTGLGSVTLPESLKTIEFMAFYNCSGLTDLVIPNAVLKIKDSAFQNCFNLKKLVLGQSLEYIGNDAFCADTSLEEVTIPKKVRFIGSSAFGGCTNLTRVNYNAISCECNRPYVPFGYSTKNLSTVSIGEEVKLIPAYLFSGCSKLSSVTFKNPDKLEYIGLYAFLDTQWDNHLPGGEVVYIGKVAYAYKGGSGKIEIKEGTVALAGGIFFDRGIQSIKLPNTLKMIGEGAISQNYLETIDIPESVVSVMSYALNRSRNLKTVVFPDKLDSIAAFTLKRSDKLETIYIPGSVKTIGKEAFSICPELKQIYCDVETPINIAGKDLFLDSAPLGSCKLYVPANSVELYKAAEVWKEFDVLDIASGIESVKANHGIEIIPSRGTITVKGIDGATVSVYTTTGQLVFQGTSSSIDIPAGIYIVKVYTVSQKVIVK